MEDTGWNHPPWPKRLRRDIPKKMGDGASPSTMSSGVREGTLMWPMLTRTNYSEWVMLMQCNYEAMEIWEMIKPKTNVKRAQDRQAMGTLLRSVPKEM